MAQPHIDVRYVANLARLELSDEEIASGETPEYLRIRGYRIVNQGVKKFTISEEGRWEIDSSGLRRL